MTASGSLNERSETRVVGWADLAENARLVGRYCLCLVYVCGVVHLVVLRRDSWEDQPLWVFLVIQVASGVLGMISALLCCILSLVQE